MRMRDRVVNCLLFICAIETPYDTWEHNTLSLLNTMIKCVLYILVLTLCNPAFLVFVV